MVTIFILASMGHPRLDVVQIGQIVALSQAGHGYGSIAKQLKLSKSGVRNVLKRKSKPKPKKKIGRPSKLSRKAKSRLVRSASNSQKSCRKLADDCDLDISKSTAHRIISSSPNLTHKKMAKAPRLTKKHIENRLIFAKNEMGRDWHKVIFSDEKKWNLDGCDGFRSYWHDSRKNPLVFSKRNFGGGTVMTWGAFSADGTFQIQFTSSRMNSLDYQNVLDQELAPFFVSNPNSGFTFLQDNASIHVSASTKAYLQSKNIPTIDWPACSPDVNPIENLWGILARRVYANGCQFADVNALKGAIIAEWANIPVSLLQKLASSMKSRIFDLITRKGKEINY